MTVVRPTNRLSNHKRVSNGGYWGHRAGLSAAKEARGKVATARISKQRSGHWGVGINVETRELLVAISSLIRCGRVKQALSIIDNELAGGC